MVTVEGSVGALGVATSRARGFLSGLRTRGWSRRQSSVQGTGNPESTSSQATTFVLRGRVRHSLTKVGLWLLLITGVLAIAGANTGNNALYMVVAALLGLLAVAGLVSRVHLGGLKLELTSEPEVFAVSPTVVRIRVLNRGRWRVARQVLLSYGDAAPHYLERVARKSVSIPQEAFWRRRGWQQHGQVQLMSLFPLGLYRSVVRFETHQQVLVYPEVHSADSGLIRRGVQPGDGTSRRRGRTGDLFGLRDYRRGDDPRAIHWKRSASTGELVLVEREAEESRRVSLVLDNLLPKPVSERQLERFEMLVSEAATLGLRALEEGFEVELVTRTRKVGFGSGAQQRHEILRELALLEHATPPDDGPGEVLPGAGPPLLRPSDPAAWSVRLALATPTAAGTDPRDGGTT